MTEAGVGSDLANTVTAATETEDGFVINGEKNYITNGTVSSQMCVFARHRSPAGKDLGISCFYVPGDSPGLERGSAFDKMGVRESNTGTIIFKNVFVPKSYLLGEPGRGRSARGPDRQLSKR